MSSVVSTAGRQAAVRCPPSVFLFGITSCQISEINTEVPDSAAEVPNSGTPLYSSGSQPPGLQRCWPANQGQGGLCPANRRPRNIPCSQPEARADPVQPIGGSDGAQQPWPCSPMLLILPKPLRLVHHGLPRFREAGWPARERMSPGWAPTTPT